MSISKQVTHMNLEDRSLITPIYLAMSNHMLPSGPDGFILGSLSAKVFARSGGARVSFRRDTDVHPSRGICREPQQQVRLFT